MTTIRTKACAALRDGRVAILLADRAVLGAAQFVPPRRVTALVRSSRPGREYLVDYDAPSTGDGLWTCSCVTLPGPCAHVAAVQLATGHPSAAAKEATT